MPGSLRQTALMCALLCCACATRQKASSPEQVLRELAAALERGDSRAAHALLSSELRGQLSQAQLEAALRSNPEETRALIQALKHPGPARTAAQVALGDDGPTAQLELTRDGSWQVSSPLWDFYPQGTPRDALESFTRAVEGERWDVLLGLMPDADREGLDAETLGKNLSAQKEELTRLVALLKSSLDSPIEIVGDRATMPYGESFTARLARENERWKVEDPE